jgi:hypothetical protein
MAGLYYKNNIKLENTLPIDWRYNNEGVPFVDLTEARTKVPVSMRYRGLTVNEWGVEYWWFLGTGDGDLVIKPIGGGSPYFQKTLGAGLTATVLVAEHGLNPVRGVSVLTPGRLEMNVEVEINASLDVIINSNLDLVNHILKIY